MVAGFEQRPDQRWRRRQGLAPGIEPAWIVDRQRARLEPTPALGDDGAELGSYNTMEHWIAHEKGLFLVYTRRGANNDHIIRNRAPLFMAQVDPERLVVLRATEQALVPERGASLGCYL